MKKHLFLTALVLALVMCFSCGALAADIERGYVNDYEITGLDKVVTDGNVTIMTVGQWRAEAKATATQTFFSGGEALHDDDIIIKNGEAAIVLAVGTRNPWGYPNGSVLDAGVVTEAGTGYRDTTWSIEFLANWWDSWAPGNGCDTVEFAIDEYDFDGDGEKEVAVKVTRIYDLAGSYGVEGQNNDKNLEIVTYYGAPQEGSYLYMFDGIENKGEEAVWYNGYEGYTGYQGTADGYENIAFSVTNKGDDGAATFGKGMAYPAVGSYANTIGKEGHEDFQGEYLTSFVVPAEEFTSNLGNTFAISGNGGKSGYQELYITNISNDEVEASGNRKMFDVGEKIQVEAYIVCSDKADHAVLNDFVFEQTGVATYPVVVEGIEGATGTMEVIVTKDGESLGWYTLDAAQGGALYLPAGQYSFEFEKAGYFASDAVALSIGFTDVPAGEWYDEYILSAQANGLVNGYNDGSFLPGNNITRAEFAKIIYGALAPEAVSEGTPVAFTDLTGYEWAKEAIDYLSAEGIINGYGDGTFKPAQDITRAEMAQMIYKAAGLNEVFDHEFSDVQPSSWYYNAVTVLYGYGVLDGFGDGTFRPEALATRAQATKLAVVASYADFGAYDVAAELGAKRVEVKVNVVDKDTKEATYARIGVYNADGAEYANTLYPTVRYVGDSVFYSKDANNKTVIVEIPEGEACTLEVAGEGYYFTSVPVELAIEAEDAVAGKEFTVEVEQVYSVQEGYIGGDVHHHTNKNDAFALPEDIVRSYLVSGLDVVSTTDHDYTVNNARTYKFISESTGDDLLGYMPSVEISCSWAHFNVVPLTEESWNYYIDADVTNSPVKDENGIALAFTNLKYFLNDVNSHGASLTANHPWYSYGLFTALGKDAVPGGYTDGYDMIGLNGSYRDQEMSKTINSGFDLWDGYLQYVEEGEGTATINGKEVEVASTHYYAGGSDTHDVLTPYATNKAATSDVLRENREEFFTGKVRSYAAVETEAGDYAGNALAYGAAMVNGNSYTTTGPILNLSKVPGNNADGTINAYPVNEDGVFELNVEIGSLDGIRDVLVLTDEAEGSYTAYTGKAGENDLGVRFKRQFALTHVDPALSLATGLEEAQDAPNVCGITGKKEIVNDYTLELKYAPKTEGLHWVAVCVVDIYGNFAVTNAYWVEK